MMGAFFLSAGEDRLWNCNMEMMGTLKLVTRKSLMGVALNCCCGLGSLACGLGSLACTLGTMRRDSSSEPSAHAED